MSKNPSRSPDGGQPAQLRPSEPDEHDITAESGTAPEPVPTPDAAGQHSDPPRCELAECGQPFSSSRPGQKFCRPEHRERHRRNRLEARASSAAPPPAEDSTPPSGHAVWDGEAWSLSGFEPTTPVIPDPPLPQPRVFSTSKGTHAQIGRAGSGLAVGSGLSLAEPVAVLPGDTDTHRAEAHGSAGGEFPAADQGLDVPPALRSAASLRARSAASSRSMVGALVTGGRHRPRAIAVGLAVATFGFGMWGLIPAPDTPVAVQEAVAPPAATQKVTPAAWVSQARSALATTQAQLNVVNAALSEWEGTARGGAVRRQPPEVAQLYAQRDRLQAQQTLLQNELADADALPSDTAALAALQARLGQITAALAGPTGAGQQAANIDALTAQRDWLTAQISALQNQIGSLTQSVAGAQRTPLPDLTDTSTPAALAVSDLAHDPLQDPWIGSQDVAPSPLGNPQYPSSPARSDATTGAPPGGDQGQGNQRNHGGVLTDVGDVTQALFGGGHGNHGAANDASDNGGSGAGSSDPMSSLPDVSQPDPDAPTGPGAGGLGDNGAGSTDPTDGSVVHGPVVNPLPGVTDPVVGDPIGGGSGKYDGPPTPGDPFPIGISGVIWSIFNQPPVIDADTITVPPTSSTVTQSPGSITLAAADTSTPTSVPVVGTPAPAAAGITGTTTGAKASSTAAKSTTSSSSSSPSTPKAAVTTSTNKAKTPTTSKASTSKTSTSKTSTSKTKKSSTSKAKTSSSKKASSTKKASSSKAKKSSSSSTAKSTSSKPTKSTSKGGTTK